MKPTAYKGQNFFNKVNLMQVLFKKNKCDKTS